MPLDPMPPHQAERLKELAEELNQKLNQTQTKAKTNGQWAKIIMALIDMAGSIAYISLAAKIIQISYNTFFLNNPLNPLSGGVISWRDALGAVLFFWVLHILFSTRKRGQEISWETVAEILSEWTSRLVVTGFMALMVYWVTYSG